jgi:selenium metabolism protein YedF
MKKSIDARGLACPQPVILTRKALGAGGLDKIEVTVDNDAARENVVRFLNFAGAPEPLVVSAGTLHTISAVVTPAMTAKIADGMTVSAMEEEPLPAEAQRYGGKILFFSADQIGHGDEFLGKLLVKGLLYTVSELASPPKTLVFMNSGVRLAAEREETIDLLKIIQGKGAEILVCGTCLDYYRLKEKLGAGRVSNLYEITEKFLSSADVVTVS